MSIMTDARLRLLEARLAEIERRLAGLAAASGVDVTDAAAPKAKAGTERRTAVEKTGRQSRKPR